MRSARFCIAIVISLLTLITVVLFITRPFPRPSVNVPLVLAPQAYGDFLQGRLEKRLNALYDGVQTFVLFIGHARSGHSLIGAIIDAHPEIIIPHEYNVTNKWHDYKNKSSRMSDKLKTRLFFDLHSLSRYQAMFRYRASSRCNGNRYCYNVPGQWQGTYRDRIKVIGDKKGTSTSRLLTNPENFKVLEDITRTLKVPLKFIHVIRNPFDNIATKLLRHLKVRDMARDSTFKANNSTLLDEIIAGYFVNVESAQRLRQYGKYEVLDVYSHEVISKPRENLQTLCNFLEVTCDNDYIDASSKLLYSKPSLTRHSIVWTTKQKANIKNETKKYPFMKPFSFDNDY